MARYSDELIDEIKSKNDIVDIISQYVVLKRSGRNFFGLCPFHKEKSPSFSVSPDKQIFHCFGCGVGGDVFRFISKIENVSFREAVETLAEKSGIELPTLDGEVDSRLMKLRAKVYEINELAARFYHENLYLPSAKPAQEYVKKRKLDNKTLKNFLIGYSPNSFNELYTRCRSMITALSVCSINSKILNSNELAELLYMAYNRDDADIYQLDRALDAKYDELYVTAEDVLDKRKRVLDKKIEEEALIKANEKLNEGVQENEKEREVREKEQNLEELISKMAKMIIDENEQLVGSKVAKIAKEKIDEKDEGKGGN